MHDHLVVMSFYLVFSFASLVFLIHYQYVPIEIHIFARTYKVIKVTIKLNVPPLTAAFIIIFKPFNLELAKIMGA
jgi:hypothetical protein